MSVFKRTRVGKRGARLQAGKYTIEFVGPDAVVRRVGGFADRRASEELERGILRLVALRAAGAAPDAEAQRFIEACPAAIRDKLAAWGIVDGQLAAGGKRLSALVDAWAANMTARELAPRHRKQAEARVRRVFKGCGFRNFSDIDPEKVANWLTARRHDDDMSFRTSNSHLASLKAFCNFMVDSGQAGANPLARLKKLNEGLDVRIERRPFTPEELSALLAATEAGEQHHGLTGPERCLLYRTAWETGLRYSELHGLKRGDFDFAGNCLAVRASVAKNSKLDNLPLRPELSAALTDYMRGFPMDGRAFPTMPRNKGALMLHRDMKAAGIPIFDEYGRKADFHCFRGTTATLLSDAGIPLATVQKIMRHSTADLTSKHYTRLSIAGKAAAVAKLPDIRPAGDPETETMRATGTDDFTAEKIDRKLTVTGRKIGQFRYKTV